MKYLPIKTIFKRTLIRVSLCFEGLQRMFLFHFSYFFCGIIKLTCEFRHKTFINLRLWHMSYLRPLELFLRNLRFAANKFNNSAACGNTYAPISPSPLHTQATESHLTEVKLVRVFLQFFTKSLGKQWWWNIFVRFSYTKKTRYKMSF